MCGVRVRDHGNRRVFRDGGRILDERLEKRGAGLGLEVQIDAEAANRELREEIGYSANALSYVGEIRPFSKYLDVKTFVFIGRELVSSPLPGDEDHEIDMHLATSDDLRTLIRSGKINDARVIAALCMSGVVSLH